MPLYSIGDKRVELHGAHHFVAPDATLVGAITLEADVNVWFQVVIRAENDVVRIGEATNVQDGSVLHVDPGFPLTLGRRVTVGHKVMLHGCTVGDGSLIGINSVVMNGARIGKSSLVGANTLIPEGKEIPDGVLVLGSPGKIVRELRPEERERLLAIAVGYVEPSRRMVSPFSISFSMMLRASCAYSDGRPRREGNGTCLASESCASLGSPFIIGVSKRPGAIVHTRMPLRDRSRAMGSVMPTTPPLEAEYAAWPICPS